MGGCKPIIMIFARGSTEIGNMGAICGPPTANGVKAKFGAGNVAVEGVDCEFQGALDRKRRRKTIGEQKKRRRKTGRKENEHHICRVKNPVC